MQEVVMGKVEAGYNSQTLTIENGKRELSFLSILCPALQIQYLTVDWLEPCRVETITILMLKENQITHSYAHLLLLQGLSKYLT